MDGATVQHDATVAGALNYLRPMAAKPVSYTFEPPPGVPWRSHSYDTHTIAIANGRRLAARPSLDREGFELVPRASAVKDFYDPDELKRVYYPESERLLRAVSGASRVLAFDHNIRSSSPDQRERYGLREPVTRVHNDYTLTSAPQRVRDLLPDEADELLQYRFAIVNVWRPIRAPLQDHPLAVCDAQSMRLEDFVGTDLVYRDRTGETYSVLWRPEHRWFYFPNMQRNEALLLKGYDSSEDDGCARFTAHSAFADPTTPADAPPRESIELRAVLFFAPSH